MSILDQISHQNKVLILGFAREGQSSANFLHQKFPKLQIDHVDQNDGPDYLLNIKHYALVIKSPGVSPHKPEIVAAKKSGVQFTSQMQIFLEECPGKIIGVTGTKGKSTTASLIHHVLSQNNIKSVLVGNIGKPVLDYLDEIDKDTWVVCEMSSYQLMNLTTSPHIAVLQNIYPDHLDYHTDFEEYKNAKLNITKYQTENDILISPLHVPTRARLIPISPPTTPVPSQLLGSHNQLNIQPSIVIGELLGIPKPAILKSIKSFQPLETRLEPIAEKSGIKFYADTLATIPEATIAAIDALHPKTLIAGGHDRHQDYSDLAKKIVSSEIKTVILFPATGPRLADLINQLTDSPINIFHANSMPQAVRLAFEHTPKNSVCLLSPAAPSFTLFKDYRDERDQFITAITSLTT